MDFACGAPRAAPGARPRRRAGAARPSPPTPARPRQHADTARPSPPNPGATTATCRCGQAGPANPGVTTATCRHSQTRPAAPMVATHRPQSPGRSIKPTPAPPRHPPMGARRGDDRARDRRAPPFRRAGPATRSVGTPTTTWRFAAAALPVDVLVHIRHAPCGRGVPLLDPRPGRAVANACPTGWRLVAGERRWRSRDGTSENVDHVPVDG
jgi:hypothetical protein